MAVPNSVCSGWSTHTPVLAALPLWLHLGRGVRIGNVGFP